MALTWSKASQIYLQFFNSDTDRLRRELLDPILLEFVNPGGKTILDLGCGEGYFTRRLKSEGANLVIGADVAPGLLAEAKVKDEKGDYRLFDAAQDQIFMAGQFDAVVANMVLMDFPDLDLAFQKIAGFLRDGGQLTASIVNPYYAFPVGVWKRQVRSILQGNLGPVLQITNYFQPQNSKVVLPGTKTALVHHHWRLGQYLLLARRYGFILDHLVEPRLSPELERKYKGVFLAQQLLTVPLYLVLNFCFNKK